MDSKHVKGSKTLPKTARRLFCNNFLSLLNNVSSKISIVVVSEILRLFVKILTPNGKYPLSENASA